MIGKSFCTVVVVVGLCVTNRSASGQDRPASTDAVAPQTEQTPTGEQQLANLKSAFQSALDDLQEKYRRADTDEQRQTVQTKYEQLQKEKVSEALQLASEHSGSKLAGQTFSWLFQAIVADATRQMAKERWLELHLNDPHLAPTLVILGMADDRDFLRDVIQRATNKTVLSAACFNLAMSIRRGGEMTGEQEAEVIALLARIQNEFANIMFVLPDGQPGGRLGDLSGPPLYELQHLTVGKTVPDIEGEDIDGRKFRLSDYRGKVVVLSFWGHW